MGRPLDWTCGDTVTSGLEPRLANSVASSVASSRDQGQTVTDADHPHLVILDEAAQALRAHFLGWQCRVRQYAVRQGGGRPTSGMRPRILLVEPEADLGTVTVMINKFEPQTVTSQFRHLARKTHDPVERYDSALKLLSSAYYQKPEEFSDELAALFGEVSETAERLLAGSGCRLLFEQYNQSYDLPCAPRQLPEDHPAFQATLWHNSLFNPNIPGGVRVLAFRPDWSRATADPPAT